MDDQPQGVTISVKTRIALTIASLAGAIGCIMFLHHYADQVGTQAEANQADTGPEQPKGAHVSPNGGEAGTIAQIESKIPVTPAAQHAVRAGHCPADMVEVKGAYCPDLKETCAEWADKGVAIRCKRFVKPSTCKGSTVNKRFCIDRYEYPNVKGMTPKALVSWDQAHTTCASLGKRLCRESEWVFACQGKDRKPYPYGYVRDNTACRIDLGGKEPKLDEARRQGLETFSPPRAHRVNVNFSHPSGEYPRCVSDFGVHDLTGNLDEWVMTDADGPSPLKGGWWGNLRNRCEGATYAHTRDYYDVQVGFRCCKDTAQ